MKPNLMALFVSVLAATAMADGGKDVSSNAIGVNSVGLSFNSHTIGAPNTDSKLRPSRSVECRAKNLTLTADSNSDLIGGSYTIKHDSVSSYISATDIQTGESSDEVEFQKTSERLNIRNVKHSIGECFVSLDQTYDQKIAFVKFRGEVETKIGLNLGDELKLKCREKMFVPHYFCRY